MSKKLETYWLRWKCGEWVLMRGRKAVAIYAYQKDEAIWNARLDCRNRWECDGIPNRLNICRKDGSIAKEASYGADSKRRKG